MAILKNILFMVLFFGFLSGMPETAFCVMVSIPGDNMEYLNRIIDGTSVVIKQERLNGGRYYPLWPIGQEIAFKILDDNSDVAEGMLLSFFGLNSKAAKVSLLQTEGSPAIHVVMSNKIKSWGDVELLLKSRFPLESLPSGLADRPYTGCNYAQFSDGENINSAFIVVETDFNHEDLVKCLYRTSFSVFGYVPDVGAGFELKPDFDYVILRTMYDLSKNDRLLDIFLRKLVQNLKNR